MIANILMIIFLLWAGGVIFVSVGLAIIKVLDILENNYD